MKPIVLIGHKHDCPIHGIGEVVSGTSATMVSGREVACVGDRTSCGAVIESGSPSYAIAGKAVARLGDTTDHGGTLIEGDSGWLVG
ncbi:PAAR domain-containing protein [Pseudomonas shirazensis]|uniref:PAAR domain-containing protein n=1 Tax=Pseudomonas shirazensis TaxID=2745494 RepID=UPI003D2BEE69